MRNRRLRLPALLSAIMMAYCGMAHSAAPAERYDFDIPAQDLSAALRELAAASQHKLFFRSDVVAGKKSPALKGSFTLNEAIAALLEASGLLFEITPDLVVLIKSPDVALDDQAQDKTTSSSVPVMGPSPIQLAQLDPATSDSTAQPVARVAGPIRGHVSSLETGGSLPGALVRILETGQTATTDPLGNFRTPTLAPGEYTLSIAYIGYAERLWRVTVGDSEGQGTEFALDKSAFDGDEVTVFGTRSARSLALNQQKTAENYQSIVSADMLGNFTGTTLAEALRRVEGVAFVRDGVTGDGTNVVIRGLEPNMNAIKLNGLNLPVGNGIDRSANLSNILADSVSKITISKTLLPSQDSAGTGGLVEIETKSPLDRPHRYANFALENGRKGKDFANDWLASGTVSGTFGAERNKGLSASVQYRKRQAMNIGYNIFAYQGLYLPLAPDGTPTLTDSYQIDPRLYFPWEPGVDKAYVTAVTNGLSNVDTTAWAATVSGQWQIGDHTSLKLDLQRALDEGETFDSRAAVVANVLYAPLPLNQLDGEIRQALYWDGTAYAEQIYSISQSENVTDTYSFQGRTAVGKVELSYLLGRARGSSETPYSGSFSIDFGGQLNSFPLDASYIVADAVDPAEQRVITPFGLRTGRGYQLPRLTPAGFAFFNDSDTYELTYVGGPVYHVKGYNNRDTAELSARYDIGRKHLRYVELGVDFERARFGAFSVGQTFSPVCDGACASIGQYGLTLSASNLQPIGISGPGLNVISRHDVRAFFANVPQFARQGQLRLNRAIVDPRIYDQFTEENNLATYLQTRAEFGKFEIIGGVRMSRVDVNAVNLAHPTLLDENNVPDLEFERQFSKLLDESAVGTDLLPRVLVNFRQSDNLVFRAGYFLSVARPSIDQLSREQSILLMLAPLSGPARNQPYLSIVEGNPALKPSLTHNLDLAAEWYNDQIGVIRLAGFYKQIENLLETITFHGDNQLVGTTLPDYPAFHDLPDNLYVERYRPFNSSDPARLWGIEAAVERQLTFLPGAWNGLGVLFNYTFSDSSRKQYEQWQGVPYFDDEGNYVQDSVNVLMPNGSFGLQSAQTGTAALTYNKYGYDATLAFSYQARAVQGGSSPHGLTYFNEAVKSLDLRVARRLTSGFGDITISLEGTDLLKNTGSPDLESTIGGEHGTPKYYNQAGFIGGRSFRLGVSASF